jgi:uncharacterized protein YigA (DUF484 family)
MTASNDAVVRSGDTALDDEQVRNYLKQHSDFLQRHPDIIDCLHIAHASGAAVSLVEKQVSILRERNMEMRHRLNALTANARENDRLYERTRQLVLELLDARDLAQLCRSYLACMRDDFEVEHACIILYGDPAGSNGELRYEEPEAVKREVGGLLKGRKPLCGTLRAQELRFLFPRLTPASPGPEEGQGASASDSAGSAAIMPLRGARKLGLIAVGSSDANHYYRGMGTLFLLHIAEVMVRILDRLPDTANS